MKSRTPDVLHFHNGRLVPTESHPADAAGDGDFDKAMETLGYSKGIQDCEAWATVTIYENHQAEYPWIVVVSPCGNACTSAKGTGQIR